MPTHNLCKSKGKNHIGEPFEPKIAAEYVIKHIIGASYTLLYGLKAVFERFLVDFIQTLARFVGATGVQPVEYR